MGSQAVEDMLIRSDEESEREEDEEEDNLIRFLLTVNMEMRRDRRRYIRPLNKTKPEQDKMNVMVQQMWEMDDGRRFSYFCISDAHFNKLVHLISSHIKRTHKWTRIPVSKRLAVALQVLAYGSSHAAVAARYKIVKSTVRHIVSEVSKALWLALKDEFLTFPSVTQLQGIALEFGRSWNFPNCVGAIARRHMKVKASPGARSDYIVLMAACDTRYRLFMVDIAAYGKESFRVVFDRSSFGSALNSGQLPLPPPAYLPGTTIEAPHVFIGDAAFPLHVNLMCPYEDHRLTEREVTYNYRHSHASRIIENAFDILAARWRILGSSIDCYLDRAVDVVRACVCLHNYLISADGDATQTSRYIPPDFVASATATVEIPNEAWRQQVQGDNNLHRPGQLSAAQASRGAQIIRDDFADYFLSPAGSVP